MANNKPLDGKVAIVTGATGSIGQSIALTLAREGASVMVHYHGNDDGANQIVDYIHNQNGTAFAVQADIFESAGCQALVEKTLEHFGKIDICVINPGGGWHVESPDTMNPSDALDCIQKETASVLYLLPLLLSQMYQQKWGRIVGIGMNPQLPSPAYIYNIAKAARHTTILEAANDAWKHRVTLNVVAPGPVAEISTFNEATEQSQGDDLWLNRPTTSSQDIAESVAFLCSEAGRFITGAVIPFQFSP